MSNTTDRSVLQHIEELVAREHQLHGQEAMSEEERAKLRNIQVELDQCWDLLRRRRALRTVGDDPDKAEVRPPDVVEKYEQ
jgi:hypothetical protein